MVERTPLNLQKIKDALNEVTAGPWEVYDQAHDEGWDYPSCAVQSTTDALADWVAELVHTNDNATFIANAREWVPALVEELEASRAALAELVAHIIGTDCYKHTPDNVLKRARELAAGLGERNTPADDENLPA